MRQTKTHFAMLYIVLAVFGLSCSKKFEDHYNPAGKIDKNIVQILSEDPAHSDFVKIIDKLGLRKALGESAIYTCLAPTNEHVDAYLKANKYATIDDVPEVKLRQYLNNHFINGRYYKYDIEKRYKDAVSGLAPTKATYFTTRAEQKLPAKSIRIFTPAFFNVQQDDYKTIYNISGEGFTIENAKISETRYDIDANNGVIHVLESPLPILPRTDIAIASNNETSIFNKWLNLHVVYTLGAKDEFGWVDTALIKTYSQIRNLADESVLSTVFVPTDQAIMEYFTPYLPDLYNTIDSVPKTIISEILKANVLAEPWFKSDIIRNNPELRTSTYPQLINKIAPTIVGSILSSNSIIYKVNKLIEPPKLHSVEGGVYMKKRLYSQWNWMFEHTTLEAGLTEGLFYQHSPKTILLQPDTHWGSPLAEELQTDLLLVRQNECKTGILNIDVRQDGGFRKRYYPTEFGYILYDSNKFFDYTGKSVSLLKNSPTWERVNGAIYEIDGFLTPMNKLDLTRTVYALVGKDTQLSSFKLALDKSGLVPELNLTGFFTYTVFAPTNTAMQAAGINVSTATQQQMRDFVSAYIVPNRYIFTDGIFSGNIPDKNGAYITVTGAWENFSIKRTSGSGPTIKPVATSMNVQGSNGVVHKINQIF